MSNQLAIKTQAVTDLYDESISYQHFIYDDFDEVQVWLGDGKAGLRQARKDMKAGVGTIIEKVYASPNNDGRAAEMLQNASNNEKGVDVNGDYVQPEELLEILKICDEKEDVDA